ncbi:hypothetical protein CI109_106865 [Kwoniella shandongensis]|uniref:Uncharacterized protein n=1 Tax=Kwoniella shandongensis TaxID=1734106 RepID=A0A5M6CC75_9TREE|nr:uncharacterized protein CI109_000879 [Kwoniella shandongensis]KAA5530699.1 hypothetical protein CI109_000879 [Kwoniella shandongensis]
MSASPALHPPATRSPVTTTTTSASSFDTARSSLENTSVGVDGVAALRAAALRTRQGGSASGSVSPAPSSLLAKRETSPSRPEFVASSSTLATRVGAQPLSKYVGKVTQEEKEEGEISEDDEQPVENHTQDRRPSRGRSSFNGGRKSKSKSRSHSPKKRRSPSKNTIVPQRRPSVTTARSISPVKQIIDQRRPSNAEDREKPVPVEIDEAVAPAPSEISPSEARDYMEIIRNLIHEGVSPDTLVQKGATPKYVMAVCEEIVEGTRKRKKLWLETREREVDSEPPIERAPRSLDIDQKSPSPDVEISISTAVDMARRESTSSEDSAEMTLVERMSPPKSLPLRFQPSSSWTPPVLPSSSSSPAPSAQPLSPYAQAFKVESYKPIPRPASAGRLAPGPSYSFQPSASASAMTSPAVRVSPAEMIFPAGPSRPQAAKPSVGHEDASHPRRKKRSAGRGLDNGLSAGADVVLNYGDDVVHDTPTSAHSQPPPPVDSPPSLPPSTLPPFALSSSTSQSVSILPPIQTQSDAATQSALLETRRKALESMKRRRAALEAKPLVVSDTGNAVQTESVAEAPGPTSEETELEKTIEQQMADLEKEVLNSHNANAEVDMDMDIDEPEEGEITAPSPPRPTSARAAPVVISNSLPTTTFPRGKKRALAEDLMETRSAAPVRASLPPRRRPFWAMQRPQKLILHLDDSSDSSDDEETGTPLQDSDSSASQAQLEENIRSLQERIAKLKAKKAKQALGAQISTPPNSASVQVTSGAEDVNITAPTVEQSPASLNVINASTTAEVRQLTKELVQAEAEAEAMNVDAPSVDDPIIIDDEPDVPSVEPSAKEVRPRSVSPSVIQTTSNKPTAMSELPQSHSDAFQSYKPLLPRYPQLTHDVDVSTSLSAYISPLPASSPPQTSKTHLPTQIDRSLLQSIILTNRTLREPGAMMCKAESGGGKCADRNCQSLHLSKGLTPTDDDLVEYISQTNPLKSKKSITKASIKEAKEALLSDNASLSITAAQGFQAGMHSTTLDFNDDRVLSAFLDRVDKHGTE